MQIEKKINILLILPQTSEILRLRRKYPSAKIICLIDTSEDFQNKNFVDEVLKFDDFLPDDFVSLYRQKGFDLLGHLMKCGNGGSIPSRIKELLYVGRFHWLTKVAFPVIRRFDILEHVLDNNPQINMIYAKRADLDFLKYRGFFTSQRYGVSAIITKLLDILHIPFSFVYHYIFLPVRSRPYTTNALGQRISQATLLFGNINECLHFYRELDGILDVKYKKYILFHPMRRFSKFLPLKSQFSKDYSFYPIEGLLSLSKIFSLGFYYFHISFKLFRVLRREFRPKLGTLFLRNTLLSQTIRFFLYFSAESIKYAEAVKNLSHVIPETTNIFFTHPHIMPMNIINNVLLSSGFKTGTYNHGLIQAPLEFINETTLCVSSSSYDLSVTQKISENIEYLHIKRDQLKIKMKPISESVRVLILGSIFYQGAPVGLGIEYLRRTFDGLCNCALNIRSIKYKPHPKENTDRIADRFDMKEKRIQIAGHDLKKELKNADLVITPLSTTVLFCLEEGVPFLIYAYGRESYETFFAEVPECIVFKNANELTLSLKYISDLSEQEFQGKYEKMWQTYYFGKR